MVSTKHLERPFSVHTSEKVWLLEQNDDPLELLKMFSDSHIFKNTPLKVSCQSPTVLRRKWLLEGKYENEDNI